MPIGYRETTLHDMSVRSAYQPYSTFCDGEYHVVPNGGTNHDIRIPKLDLSGVRPSSSEQAPRAAKTFSVPTNDYNHPLINPSVVQSTIDMIVNCGRPVVTKQRQNPRYPQQRQRVKKSSSKEVIPKSNNNFINELKSGDSLTMRNNKKTTFDKVQVYRTPVDTVKTSEKSESRKVGKKSVSMIDLDLPKHYMENPTGGVPLSDVPTRIARVSNRDIPCNRTWQDGGKFNSNTSGSTRIIRTYDGRRRAPMHKETQSLSKYEKQKTAQVEKIKCSKKVTYSDKDMVVNQNCIPEKTKMYTWPDRHSANNDEQTKTIRTNDIQQNRQLNTEKRLLKCPKRTSSNSTSPESHNFNFKARAMPKVIYTSSYRESLHRKLVLPKAVIAEHIEKESRIAGSQQGQKTKHGNMSVKENVPPTSILKAVISPPTTKIKEKEQERRITVSTSCDSMRIMHSDSEEGSSFSDLIAVPKMRDVCLQTKPQVCNKCKKYRNMYNEVSEERKKLQIKTADYDELKSTKIQLQFLCNAKSCAMNVCHNQIEALKKENKMMERYIQFNFLTERLTNCIKASGTGS